MMINIWKFDNKWDNIKKGIAVKIIYEKSCSRNKDIKYLKCNKAIKWINKNKKGALLQAHICQKNKYL